jgi:lysophospholipase L1-like esterase
MLVTEGVFRLVVPFPPSSAGTYRSDSQALYVHAESSVGWEVSPLNEYEPVKLRYNSHGFRNPEFPMTKEPGEVRVAILGDSIVEARQVAEADTASALLERLLSIKFTMVRVINAGISAYTTTTEYLFLRSRVLAFDLDVVVLVLFANDYADNFIYGNYSAYPALFEGKVPQELVPRMSVPPTSGIKAWLKRNLAVAAYADMLVKNAKTRENLTSPITDLATTDDFRRSLRNFNKALLNEDEQAVLEFTHRGVAEIARLCRENGVRLIIAIAPFPAQVTRDENKLGKQRFGFGPDQLIEERVFQDRLLAVAETLEVPSVDLLPVMKRAASHERPLFFSYDGHLTVYGNEVLASALLEPVTKALEEAILR